MATSSDARPHHPLLPGRLRRLLPAAFVYPDDGARHVLIDFGTTALPGAPPRTRWCASPRTSRQMRGGKLTAVVATHRHAGPYQRLRDASGRRRPGDIIRSLKPDLVVQPWTEDPKAARSSSGPVTAATADSALVGTLDACTRCPELVLLESRAAGRRTCASANTYAEQLRSWARTTSSNAPRSRTSWPWARRGAPSTFATARRARWRDCCPA